MSTPPAEVRPPIWREIPAPPDRRRRAASTGAAVLILALVAGLAPAARAGALFGVASLLGVAVAAAVVGVVVARTPPVWPPGWVRIVGVAGAVVLAAGTGGRISGAWLLLGAIGAAGVAAGWHAHPDRSALYGLGPVIGTAVGAAVVAAVHPTAPITHLLVFIATALALSAARWSGVLAAFDGAARRVAHRVGEAIAVGCFAILAVPFVLLPWLIGRIVRWDPTWSPTAQGSTWSPAATEPQPSTRSWLASPPPRTWPWHRRLSRAIVRVGVVVVVLALALHAVRVRVRSSEPSSALLASPAMADADYWPDLARAQDQLRANMGFGSYVYEQPDVSSPYLNIRDGHRVTWTPPAPSTCRPLQVWMFGGSTTFGEGQRDEHTVPSELARAAWADGVALDVTNFGQLGDPHWVETRRLAEALGTTDDRPDLVIFYDGANEVITRISLNDQGRAGQQTFVSYLDAGLFVQLDRFLRPIYEFTTESGALDVDRPATGRLEADQVADLAARQYRLSLEDSRRLVAQEDLPTLWFNQPTTWTTLDEAAVPYQEEADRFGKAVTDAYEAQLPSGVIDLSDLFVGVEAPVFYDTAHTNEAGAKAVAGAIWTQARPTLAEACDEETSCC